MDSLSKIIPDRSGGVYLGGFNNHMADEEHLYCAEQASGQDQDIEVRYVSFADIKGGDAFPAEEAKTMYNRGGALFIKLEPWSAAGNNDDSFDLNELLAGKYDVLLYNFAKGMKRHWGLSASRPVFVTFGHEPQITDKYPWGKDPELYKEAFRYVHDLINKYTDKVTWVWNPNVGDNLETYDPGPGYYSWIALDGYHPRSGNTFQKIFEPSLDQIAKKHPDMPVMIGEFASNAPERTGIFNEAIDYIAGGPHKNRLKAFIYFNVNEEGFNWAILDQKDKDAYAAALQKHEALFRQTIQLADGSYLPRKARTLPASFNGDRDHCSEIDGFWYGFWQKKNVDSLNDDLYKGELSFLSFGGLIRLGDPHEDNLMRITLTQKITGLANYIDKEKEEKINELYQKAVKYMEDAQNDRDPNLFYLPGTPYIRYYFESRLQQAEIFRDSGKADESIRVCNDILGSQNEIFKDGKYLQRGGLHNPIVRYAHNIREESVDGMTARAQLILADDHCLIGSPEDLAKALEYYNKVIKWANDETNPFNSSFIPDVVGEAGNWVKLAWKSGEYSQLREKILYLAAEAKLGKAEVLVRLGGEANLQAAFELYLDVLNWEAVGQEKGFMDLAYKALIGAMAGCVAPRDLNRSRAWNYDQLVARFESSLPWGKINGYADLKKSLNLNGVDLTQKSPAQKWELFKDRLRYVKVGARYESQLRRVNHALEDIPKDKNK